MKKKIIMFIMALALCVLSVIPAMAADDMSMYVVDEANLLTDKEEESLYNTMKEISEKQKCSVLKAKACRILPMTTTITIAMVMEIKEMALCF
jgi:hypothetical protein